MKLYLESIGNDVTVKNLYKEKFDPVLTEAERDSYYKESFVTEKVKNDII